MDFEERSTHVYRQKQMLSKEELLAKESLCVHEQPGILCGSLSVETGYERINPGSGSR